MICIGELGVDPGEQVLVADQPAEQAAGLAQVSVGLPPLLVVGDPVGAGDMCFRVGAVHQEVVPPRFPGRVRLQPQHGLVDVADVHQSPGEGEDFASCLEAGLEGVMASDDLEDVEVAALDTGGGPLLGDRGVQACAAVDDGHRGGGVALQDLQPGDLLFAIAPCQSRTWWPSVAISRHQDWK